MIGDSVNVLGKQHIQKFLCVLDCPFYYESYQDLGKSHGFLFPSFHIGMYLRGKFGYAELKTPLTHDLETQ